MHEFDLIKTYFEPLSRDHPGAFALSDDGAVLRPAEGNELVVSTDCLVSGVHFHDGEEPGNIARKSLRVNLSDLASMGAAPIGYMLALSLPAELAVSPWLEAFTAGLLTDQTAFGINLIGGDTTKTPGPLTISITVFGECPFGSVLRRNTAIAGDEVWVTGYIGDAALALSLETSPAGLPEGVDTNYLGNRLRLPEPRLKMGESLRQLAHAAIDISDGFAADLGHVCTASRCAAEIKLAHMPLSSSAAILVDHNSDYWNNILSGGDDYELLFTAPPNVHNDILSIGDELGVLVSPIGSITEGESFTIIDRDGLPVELPTSGFMHF